MARPLQKKKNKSSLPRVRQKPKSKAVSIKSNPIVAAHWNQSLTLRQNYKNLGLSARLNSSTGGIEKKYKAETKIEHDGLVVPRNKKSTQLEPARVRVVRDEKGTITDVVQDENKERRKLKNPLNDPLNDLSSDEDGDERDADRRTTVRKFGGLGIVPELEESAKYGKRKRPRKQSQREQEWIERLVERHGEDYGAMVRDRKLNPMQQSEGDLKRRVAIWKRELTTEGGLEIVVEG